VPAGPHNTTTTLLPLVHETPSGVSDSCTYDGPGCCTGGKCFFGECASTCCGFNSQASCVAHQELVARMAALPKEAITPIDVIFAPPTKDLGKPQLSGQGSALDAGAAWRAALNWLGFMVFAIWVLWLVLCKCGCAPRLLQAFHNSERVFLRSRTDGLLRVEQEPTLDSELPGSDLVRHPDQHCSREHCRQRSARESPEEVQQYVIQEAPASEHGAAACGFLDPVASSQWLELPRDSDGLGLGQPFSFHPSGHTEAQGPSGGSVTSPSALAIHQEIAFEVGVPALQHQCGVVEGADQHFGQPPSLDHTEQQGSAQAGPHVTQAPTISQGQQAAERWLEPADDF